MIYKGYQLADRIIADLKARQAPTHALAVIQVGDDPVSTLYVSKKKDLAERLGVNFKLVKLDQTIGEDELKDKILQLNSDRSIGGILVQMPLPSHVDRLKIASAIEPDKDIDGFHCILKSPRFSCFPPTVLAIDEILDFYKVPKAGRKLLIVGGGFLVGAPLEAFWQKRGLNVSILEKNDSNYEAKIKEADIVVLSTGGGKIFSAKDFKIGATVVDASTVSDDGQVRGDVKWDEWPDDINLVPVPGGIGPVTVSILIRNFFNL